MRHVNWNTVQASTEGEFKQLPAGPYVARITEATDNDQREYVEVVFDIAEGEHKGFYGDEWGQSHPYAHHFFMSYRDTALGMLKGRLQAIQESNPGFDAFAAWDAGRLDMFRNRLVGVNIQEEEYEKNDGSVGTRMNVCQVASADKVRSGAIKARPKKELNGGGTASRPAFNTSAARTEPIPFD